MNMERLKTLAREAGARGDDWTYFTAISAVQDATGSGDGLRSEDIDALEAVYGEGRVVWLRAEGWQEIWTTAPFDYDWRSSTRVLDPSAGSWHGKPLRRLLVEPRLRTAQRDRYGSGLHLSWEEDPRIEEERQQRMLLEERVHAAERERLYAEGLVWLAALSDDGLSLTEEKDPDRPDFPLYESHHLRHEDVRAEKKRRLEARKAAACAEKWACCHAILSDAAILVDDGDEGGYEVVEGYGYRRPRRDAKVHYGVRLSSSYGEEDADRVTIFAHGEPRREVSLGSLADVAEMIECRRLRIAKPEDVPPKPVLDRIGHSQLAEIERIEISGGDPVWVGRQRFASDVLVLDAKGRLVRKKTAQEQAIAVYGAARANKKEVP